MTVRRLEELVIADIGAGTRRSAIAAATLARHVLAVDACESLIELGEAPPGKPVLTRSPTCLLADPRRPAIFVNASKQRSRDVAALCVRRQAGNRSAPPAGLEPPCEEREIEAPRDRHAADTNTHAASRAVTHRVDGRIRAIDLSRISAWNWSLASSDRRARLAPSLPNAGQRGSQAALSVPRHARRRAFRRSCVMPTRRRSRLSCGVWHRRRVRLDGESPGPRQLIQAGLPRGPASPGTDATAFA